MKILIKNLITDPLLIYKAFYYSLLIFSYRLRGIKTVVCNIHYDYFFDILRPLYQKLSDHPDVRVFFSYKKGLKNYLQKHVNRRTLIRNTISPYIPFDIFICPETDIPDFPAFYLKTKTVELYHNTGTFNLYDKKDVLNKFDIHLSIGPQFNDFIEYAYDGMDKAPVIYNTGYARLDLLFEKPPTINTLIDEYSINSKPIILYVPHWHPGGSLHNFKENIIESLASFNAHVLIKPHNYIIENIMDIGWLGKFKSLESRFNNITYVDKHDTQELYSLADIMITDTGTTAAIEFSLLHKPLILFYNENWFLGKIHVEPEKDICDTAFRLTDMDGLRETIRLLIAEDSQITSLLEEQRKKQDTLIKKYLFNPGRATEKSANAILKEINL